MSEIDWAKAPEWADKYGVAGSKALHCWYSDKQYAYISDPKEVFIFSNFDTFSRHIKDFTTIEARPSPAWSGEGLPPVGLRCEAAIPHTCGPDNERSFIWIEGSVIAYYEIKGKTYAWFAEDDGFYPPNALEFRPIRTPEQIAADEREAAIHEIAVAMDWHPTRSAKSLAAMVYDAGYRKQADQ